MTIKQLSIFLENQSGTLVKVLDLMKQSSIQLVAVTIADTAEYGIFRMICSEPDRAYEVLHAAGVAVAQSDVFAIALDNVPGRAADAVKVFSDAGISITYLYSFVYNGKGILIFRTDSPDAARKAIEASGLEYITQDKL